MRLKNDLIFSKKIMNKHFQKMENWAYVKRMTMKFYLKATGYFPKSNHSVLHFLQLIIESNKIGINALF